MLQNFIPNSVCGLSHRKASSVSGTYILGAMPGGFNARRLRAYVENICEYPVVLLQQTGLYSPFSAAIRGMSVPLVKLIGLRLIIVKSIYPGTTFG